MSDDPIALALNELAPALDHALGAAARSSQTAADALLPRARRAGAE